MRNTMKYCYFCTTAVDPFEFQCDGCLKTLCNSCATVLPDFEQKCPDCLERPAQLEEATLA